MIPDVETEIGGEIYTLRFSARTSIAIEKAFGCKIKDLPTVIGKEPQISDVGKLVKLCMRIGDRPLTDDEFDTVLDQISIEELGNLLQQAMTSAMPAKAESAGKN